MVVDPGPGGYVLGGVAYHLAVLIDKRPGGYVATAILWYLGTPKDTTPADSPERSQTTEAPLGASWVTVATLSPSFINIA